MKDEKLKLLKTTYMKIISKVKIETDSMSIRCRNVKDFVEPHERYKAKPCKIPRRIAKGETSYGKKKSVVYVMDGDKVKRVTFGDPNMRIKKNQKGRRKNFRARHNCDNPGPKTKARYWSCKAW